MKFFSRIFFVWALMALGSSSWAGEMPFNQKVFDELRASGKPVAVHLHSFWCMVCRKQAEIASTLMNDPQFEKLTLMRANFSSEDALLKTLDANQRSTFIVFKGNAEVGRSIGDTNKENIAALLRRAL